MIYVLGVLDWFGNRYTDAVSEYTDVVVFNGFVQKIDTCRRIEGLKMTYIRMCHLYSCAIYNSEHFTCRSLSFAIQDSRGSIVSTDFPAKENLIQWQYKLKGILGCGLEFHLVLVPAPAAAGSGTGFGGGIME